MKKITHKQMEEYRRYVNYGINNNYLNEEDWEDLTDEEFIDKAKEVMNKGELLYG